MTLLPDFLVCPACHSKLTITADIVRCEQQHQFGRVGGVIDFLNAPASSAVDAAFARELNYAEEAAGLEYRMEHFLIPRIRERFGTDQVRLLDDGAGIGHLVRLLVERGVDAYGIDPGVRRAEWIDLGLTGRLCSASGCELPFADETFDVVFSSGVLEHVGDPLPASKEREIPRRAYVAEAIRVLKMHGVAYIAHPNGRHPIDYWHGPKHFRVHSPWQKWMPLPSELKRMIAASPIPAEGRFLPPEGFLAFERVRRHLYGRLLEGVMKGMFRLIRGAPSLLAGSFLNPWLVTEVTRHSPSR